MKLLGILSLLLFASVASASCPKVGPDIHPYQWATDILNSNEEISKLGYQSFLNHISKSEDFWLFDITLNANKKNVDLLFKYQLKEKDVLSMIDNPERLKSVEISDTEFLKEFEREIPIIVTRVKRYKKKCLVKPEDKKNNDLSPIHKKRALLGANNYSYYPLSGKDQGIYSLEIDWDPVVKVLNERKNKSGKSYFNYNHPSGPLSHEDVKQYNQEYFKLLEFYKEDIHKKLEDDINEAIEEQKKDSKGKSVRILELSSLEHDLTEKFLGFEQLQGNRIQLVYPAYDKGINIKIRLRISIKGKKTFLKIKIRNLRVSEIIHFEPLPNGEMHIEIPERVKVRGKVRVDVSNDILDAIVDAVEALTDPLTKALRKSVGESVTESIEDIVNDLKIRSRDIHGRDSYPPFTARENVENKRAITDKIEEKIFKHNLPYASVIAPYMNAVDILTWKDFLNLDLDNDYDFSKTKMMPAWDGAIWTGTLLSSLAFKYASTNDVAVLDRLNTLLDKIHILATINGEGPLARAAMPESSPYFSVFTENNRNGFYSTKEIAGETWYSLQGEDGISRDQYLGIMTGLINTFKNVKDPAITEKVKRTYKHLIDYLIKVNWMITADSKREVSFSDKAFPTNYAGIGYQKVTYLLGAHRMFPENENYKTLYNNNRSLIKLGWVGSYFSAVKPVDKYYSMNLQHTALYTLAQLLDKETPDDSRMLHHVARMTKLLQIYVGHHKNTYHDLVRFSIGQKADLKFDMEQMKEDISQSMNSIYYRPHMLNSAQNIYPEELELIEMIDYKEFGKDTTKPISRFVIPPHLRQGEENFAWQRSSFSGANESHWGTMAGSTGVDVLMAYWLYQLHAK